MAPACSLMRVFHVRPPPSPDLVCRKQPLLPPAGDATVVKKIPGLVAFWTLENPAAAPLSTGTSNPHPLVVPGVQCGPAERPFTPLRCAN